MHVLSILLLAAAPGGSAFDEMLRLFGIAAIVFAAFKGIRLLIPQPGAPPPAVAAPPANRPADHHAPAESIDPEIIAVIAAAVAYTSTRHRIISIRSQSSNWEKAGRQSVLTSHRIR